MPTDPLREAALAATPGPWRAVVPDELTTEGVGVERADETVYDCPYHCRCAPGSAMVEGHPDRHEDSPHEHRYHREIVGADIDRITREAVPVMEPADARYIALASPDVVIGLLDRMEELEARLDAQG